MNPYDEKKIISEYAITDQLFHDALTMDADTMKHTIATDPEFCRKLMNKFQLPSQETLIEFLQEYQAIQKMPSGHSHLVEPILMHCQNNKVPHVTLGPHLLCPYSGDFLITVNGRPLPLTRGELALVAKGVNLSFSPAGQGKHLLLNCILGNSFSDSILYRAPAESRLKQLILPDEDSQSGRSHLIFDIRKNIDVLHFMACAAMEYVLQERFHMETAMCYLTLLFAELLRSEQTPTASLQGDDRRLHDFSDLIIFYIDQNIDSVTLQSMAEYFHFHPNYLSKLIKDNTGESFSNLVQTIRLRNAAALLKSTTKPISAIAYEVGYKNVSFFYKKFAEHFQCSPTEYRANGVFMPGG